MDKLKEEQLPITAATANDDKAEGLVKTQGGEVGFMEDTSNDKRGARNSHSMGKEEGEVENGRFMESKQNIASRQPTKLNPRRRALIRAKVQEVATSTSLTRSQLSEWAARDQKREDF